MFNKIIWLGTVSLVLALSVTACQGLPNLIPQPTPTTAPTVAPMTEPAPATTPQAQSEPPLPDRGKIESALRLADLSGGIVSANKNGTLTLRLARQTTQVQTNVSTIVVIPGKNNAQVADIRVGDRVIADYGNDVTNTTAAFLLDLPSDYNTGNVWLAAVLSSKGGTINVRTRSGKDKVAANDETLIVNLSGVKPTIGSLKDLKPGNLVVVIGQDGDDAFKAQVIVVTDQDARAILNRGRGNQPAPTPTPKPGA
jgi:hypothetical protein